MSDHFNTNSSYFSLSVLRHSGLVDAVIGTGHTGESSVTAPAPSLEVLSPSPQRLVQPFIINMEYPTSKFSAGVASQNLGEDSSPNWPRPPVQRADQSTSQANSRALRAALFVSLITTLIRIKAVHYKVRNPVAVYFIHSTLTLCILKDNYTVRDRLTTQLAALLRPWVIRMKDRTSADYQAQNHPPQSQNQSQPPSHNTHNKNSAQSQGRSHGHSFGQSQPPSQGNNFPLPQAQFSQGQVFDPQQSSWEGNNSGRSHHQFPQAQDDNQTQVPLQLHGISAWQVDHPARSQMQSQIQSQLHFQPQDQSQIHSRDPVGAIHRRRSSSSRMNPAVPAFQPIYQTSFQSFQPTQGAIFDSQMPQPLQPSQSPQSAQLPQPPQLLHSPQRQQVNPMPIHQMMSSSREQHEKVNELVRRIKSIDNMNPNKQESLVQSAEELRGLYERSMHLTKNEYEKLWHEKETSKQFLNNTAVNLRQAYMERDKLGAERDAARDAIENLELQNAELSKRMNELEKQWKNFNNEMDQKLAEKNVEIERNRVRLERQRIQVERQRGQIEKQSSELAYNDARDVKFVDAAHVKWMAENPASGMHNRRNNQSIGQDPFASPSAGSSSTLPVSGMGGSGSSSSTNRVGLIGRGFGQSSALGHVQPNSGPPNATAEKMFTDLRKPSSSRRQSILPTGAPTERVTRNILELLNSSYNGMSTRHITTEPGDTPLAPSKSTALILSSISAEDPSLFYQEEFAALYQLIEGWAMAYCTTPKISNDQLIARSNQVLWTFMMKCTYPGKRQDAHTHLTTLLNNASTRPWFIVRMGVEYIVEDMLSIKSYKNFSSQVGTELATVEAQLHERGLPNDARQALIDRRAKAIQLAVSSPRWESYRNEQLSIHSRQLRDILGPMLDDKADRSKAGKDLGYIALKAWDISEHMNTSQLTFQVSFPETAGKFVAATMISKDDGHIHPMALQLSQARLKLIITPVITMRDDRGTTIKAKNLHFATVLTMK
ncbi:uncharacterized protein RAG0_05342 [Rhynchosporium agropyri]|uniref:Uncharacterized protein n=1 Tax=Rhynchosporium agropyri TaxID=914238 RepID=A0A1E1KCY7_9HELO|nr:uncharacterized protein RAG0_05342 [Rhynchosporium agropyri]